ncbi:MAG: competence/damage-inducible protein A [Chloroflexia bacterium]|nr:competence/damage-inducible protein A [Chloroflexia bacterium]
MRGYILSIGSELLHGHLTDTNATFLAQEMVAQGIELLHVVQVGDDLGRLAKTLDRALAESDVVVCTGGVGPTDDDLTREAIAAMLGEEPVVDPESLATVRGFFASRGLEMPERNAKQAWLIPSAEPLPNPVGTAPGWFVRRDAGVVIAMPGVPREMVRMWREQALPRLAPFLPRRAYRSTNVRTLGIGESAAAELLGNLTQTENPYVGTYAKDDGVHVRVTASAATDAAAEELLAATTHEVRVRLAAWIYAEDVRSLPTVLLDHLRANGLTIGIVESGTGGRFAGLLFGEPDAGDSVAGALTVAGGAGDAKTLAEAARTRFEVPLGVGLVALAEPVGNGLYEGVVEVSLAGAMSAGERFPIRAAYPEIQRRAALHAADVLRRMVLVADDAATPASPA